MEVSSYPVQSTGASTIYVSCEFCTGKFRTVAEKNVHVLDHFDHEICERCDQTLLRIGGHFYILHSTLTCNSVTDIKQEIEVDEPSDDGTHIIKVHSIDAKQFTEAEFEEEQKFDRDCNSPYTECFDSTTMQIDAPSLTIPEIETYKPDDQFSQLADAVPPSKSQAFDVFFADETSSKLCQESSLENAETETKELSGYTIGANGKYNCTKCGTTNLTKTSIQRRHQNPNFKCKECGVAFCQSSHLKNHYKIHSGADPSDGIDVSSKKSIAVERIKKKQCPVDGCNEMLTRETRFWHLRGKHRLFQVECDLCQKKFNTVNHIRMHMITHGAKTKLYNCDVCGTSNITYKNWCRFHKTQNAVCAFCGRRFCFRKHLKQHHFIDGCGPTSAIDRVEEQEIKHVITPQNTVRLESAAAHTDVPNLTMPESETNKLSGQKICVNGRYNCMKCGSMVLTRESFRLHHQVPNYKCRECDEAFCQFTHLKNHYKIHPGANPYDGIDVRSKQSIQQVLTRKKEKNIQCPVDGCNEMVSTNSRQNHLARKHRLLQAECYICKKVFKILPSLHRIRLHMNKYHGQGAPIKRYKCDKCGKSNIAIETLRIHQRQNEVCTFCGRRFCLRQHVEQHHINDHCGPDKSIVRCNVEGCNELISRNRRRHHKYIRHPEREFHCDICKKVFPRFPMIRSHILRNHVPSSKKCKCDLCGKAYLTKGELDRHHKFSHLNEKKYQCSECGKTFKTNFELVPHIMWHSGQKPFECTFEGCSKRFRTKSARVEHLRSHTGEKPYECSVADCDRKFGYAVDLRRHKYNAHGIFTNKIPCQVCGEIFPENMLLKNHMKKHNLQM